MVINRLLYLHELQLKYVNTYKDLISKIYINISVICFLSMGYLPINLIPPSKFNVIITHHKSDRIVQFLIFVQLYSQSSLTLYQKETDPVPLIDQIHMLIHTLKFSQIRNILLSLMKYICQNEELRNCEHMGYAYYCEELFIVKHKSRYSCKTTLFFTSLMTLLRVTVSLQIPLTILPLNPQYLMVKMQLY